MLQSYLVPIFAKIIRYVVAAFCAFLIHWGFAGTANSIATSETDIVTGVTGLLLAFIWDAWAHMSKTAAFAKIKEAFLMSPGASPAQVADVAIRAGTIVSLVKTDDAETSAAFGRLPIITVLLILGLSLSACSANSPFVAASESKAGDGKIPVHVEAGAAASGKTADGSPIDYSSEVKVIFGKGVPQSARDEMRKRLGIAAN